MSLDTVEFVVRVEQKFGIEIPNDDAPQLAILGDMHEYILQSLRRRGDDPDEERVWETLKEIVIDLLGVPPDDVTKTAHIVTDLGAD